MQLPVDAMLCPQLRSHRNRNQQGNLQQQQRMLQRHGGHTASAEGEWRGRGEAGTCSFFGSVRLRKQDLPAFAVAGAFWWPLRVNHVQASRGSHQKVSGVCSPEELVREDPNVKASMVAWLWMMGCLTLRLCCLPASNDIQFSVSAFSFLSSTSSSDC